MGSVSSFVIRGVWASIAALLPSVGWADVYQYGVTRVTSFVQTTNAAPNQPEYWYLFAYVNSDIPNELIDGSVSFDAPPQTTYPLLEAGEAFRQHFSGYFTNANDYYTAYPAVTYTLTADRGFGPETGDVYAPEDLFSAEVPHLTGTTFDRVHALDTTVTFDGTINGFVPIPGTDSAVVSFSVVDQGAIPPTTVLLLSLEPGDTAFQIPAGLLLPGRQYSIDLSYTTATSTPNAGFANATAGIDYVRGTSLLFTTLPIGPAPCVPMWTQANLVGRAYHAMAYDPTRGQVITFGGLDLRDRNETWAWAGDVWRLVSTEQSGGPSARRTTAMVHHSGRQSVILAGGPDEVSDTWEWNGSAWTLLSTGGYSERGYHSMAYDSARDRVVMFGGAQYNGVDYDNLGDTWEWDGVTWSQVATTGPSPRLACAMVFDPIRQRTVLFGGTEGNNFLDETWEWDGTTWARVAVGGTAPVGRFFHAMVYDPMMQGVVVYGGHDGSSNSRADVWLWDGSEWTQIVGPTPGPRQEFAMAIDEVTGKKIVFGGNEATEILADTWEGQGAAWTNVTPAIPSKRVAATLVYDSIRDRTVMFGGYFSPGGVGQLCNGETWEWDGLAWSQRATTGPSARAVAPMAFDSARGRTVMVGGWCGTSVRDTWEWDGNTWLLRSTGGPSLRHFAAVAYDAARGKTVLFGGYQPTPAEWKNDTWEWNGSTWTQIVIPGPPARYNHQMVYDASRQRIVLFGGNRESPAAIFGDTWEYNGVAWVQVSPGSPAEPAPRAGHAMAYDSARSRVMLVGGINFNPTQYLEDTWEFDGSTAAWTQSTATSPLARVSAGLAYDSLREQLVLFGGTSSSLVRERNDTWLYSSGSILSEHPRSLAIAVGESARLSVAAVGHGPFSYQWRRNGVDLVDGASIGGGVLTGSVGPILILENAGTADAGSYDAVVTGSCGSLISNTATLSVNAPCFADFNCDGFLDFFDYDEYVATFEGGVPPPCRQDADTNGDGFVDFFDYDEYVASFETGC